MSCFYISYPALFRIYPTVISFHRDSETTGIEAARTRGHEYTGIVNNCVFWGEIATSSSSRHTMAESSDLDRQIEQLKKCEIIKEAEVKALCAKAREILIEESNVQRVDSPVTVTISILCKE